MSDTRLRLTRERILRAAIALVDEHGLDALTMRRLGTALGVEAMSLYNHVPNKAALLDGIYEILAAEIPQNNLGGWPDVLRARANALRSVLSEHPNAIALLATRPAVTQGSLHHLESGLDVLVCAGLPLVDALAIFQNVRSYVIGYAITTLAPPAGGNLLDVDYRSLDAQHFPRVTAAASLLERYDSDAEFIQGIEILIAGIAAKYSEYLQRG